MQEGKIIQFSVTPAKQQRLSRWCKNYGRCFRTFMLSRGEMRCVYRESILGRKLSNKKKNPSRVKRNDLKTLLLGMKLFCSLMDYYTRATQTRDLLINSFTNKTHCPDLENSSRLISLLESELFVEESFNDVKVFFPLCGPFVDHDTVSRVSRSSTHHRTYVAALYAWFRRSLVSLALGPLNAIKSRRTEWKLTWYERAPFTATATSIGKAIFALNGICCWLRGCCRPKNSLLQQWNS